MDAGTITRLQRSEGPVLGLALLRLKHSTQRIIAGPSERLRRHVLP
jgi:hypothetical protein